jgi:hypothetical protein
MDLFYVVKPKDAVMDQLHSYRLVRKITYNIIIHTAGQSIKLSCSTLNAFLMSTVLITPLEHKAAIRECKYFHEVISLQMHSVFGIR